MNAVTRIFAALLVALSVTPAFAETLSWQLPTKNTNGSDIPATGDGALKHTEIQIGSCAGTAPNFTFGTASQTLRPLVPIVTQAWTPAIGTYCIRGRMQNNAGANSDWSSVLRYVKSAPKPGKITITITATVPP